MRQTTLMEWEEPAIVLKAAPHGESSLIVTVLTQGRGACRALVRGGRSRRQASLWQIGTIILARWKARLPEQLGHLTAELVRPTASFLLDYQLSLTLLGSACSLCVELLAEREPHPSLFSELIRFLSALSVAADAPPVALYLRWEVLLLQQVGYGLSLEQCAVTGQRRDLAYVSPRTGCAVSEEGAGEWAPRLLPLPSFLRDEAEEGEALAWYQAALLTGYFLQRAAFAVHHRPLPIARERLMELLYKAAHSSGSGQENI